MKYTPMNEGWELTWGQPSSIPMLAMYAQKTPVTLPHDFMIGLDVDPKTKNGSDMGYYPGATATYTRTVAVSEEDLQGRVLAHFDGVSGHCRVIVNGQVMGRHDYAYTPFDIDMTPALVPGDNRLAVVVSNACEEMGRWYTGAGIYREAALVTSGKLHIAPEGIFLVTKEVIDGDALVAAQIEVENHGETRETLEAEITLTLRGADAPAVVGKTRIEVGAGDTGTAFLNLVVEHARLWDIDDPQLYDVSAAIYPLTGRADADSTEGRQRAGDAPADTAQTVFGIRTISVDAVHGFRLNGRPLNLQGGCIHHDNGILGAAAHYDAEYRKVKAHRDGGFNALRFAHNPVSANMLRACDELGMLAIDEAYDIWNMPKSLNDFSNQFAEQGERELVSMVRRDRNHPCVIAWSIGNELPEQGGTSGGYETSRRLAAIVRSLDTSRPVMGAVCSFFNGLTDQDSAKFWQRMAEEAASRGNGGLVNVDNTFGRQIWPDYTAPFVADWDIVGYNYLNYQFESTHERFPQRVMVTSESKPGQMDEYWNDVLTRPYVIGDFVWTSQDYIGEAAIGRNFYIEDESEAEAVSRQMNVAEFPCRTAGCGEFDLTGFDTPQLAFRKLVWGGKDTTIEVHNPARNGYICLKGRYGWDDVANSWTWPQEDLDASAARNGGTCVMTVDVYSGGEEAELMLNGRSLGRKPVGKESLHVASFEVPYEAGTLTAISYADGAEISRDEIVSAGAPAGLKLTAVPGESGGLAFVTIEAVDAQGNAVPYVEEKITASLAEHPEHLLALGTARSITDENYTAGAITLCKGRALAVVQKAADGTAQTLTVKSDSGWEAKITL